MPELLKTFYIFDLKYQARQFNRRWSYIGTGVQAINLEARNGRDWIRIYRKNGKIFSAISNKTPWNSF